MKATNTKGKRNAWTRKALMVFAIFMVISFSYIFTTCENLVGLGMKVNTTDPTIEVPRDADGPGSFLSGSEGVISLDLEAPGDGYTIEKAFMKVEWEDDDGPHLAEVEGFLSGYKCLNDKCELYGKVIPIKEWKGKCSKCGGVKVKEAWDFPLNTHDIYCFECLESHSISDGQIKAKVTAIDSSGRETTTTEMVYSVKNMPPQIELTIPNIKGSDFDKPDLQEWLVGDPVILGFSIMGLATDNLGIQLGYPKIQIWPANLADQYIDPITKLPKKTGDPIYDRYAESYSTVVPANTRDGVTSTRFSWPMWQMVLNDKNDPNSGYRLPTSPDETRSLNPGQYRFRLETRDTDNVANYYPNRYDNPNYKPDENPIQYMEISYIAADIPIIMLQEPKQYYNGVGNYEVDLIINSQNIVTDVYAWVTDRDENPSYTSEYYSVTWVKTDGNRYIYKLTLTPEQAADWHSRPVTTNPQLFLNFEAIDERDNKSPTLYRSFLFDITAPSVQFDRPFANLPQLEGGHGFMPEYGGEFTILYPNNPPRWINGNATVSGSSLDATSGITKVYYHIGKLGDDQLNESQRIAAYVNAEWLDTHLDSFNPADHAAKWSGNVYTWQYNAAFSGDDGYNKTNHGHLIQELSELNSLGTHEGPASFITADKNRFYLPFYVKVVDGAGNFRVVHYKICVDPDLDVPYATINTPAPTIEVPVPIIGGEVRLSGTASDDDWMHSVIVRIKREDSSTWYIPTTNPPTLEVYSGGNFPGYEEDPGPKMVYNEAADEWIESGLETNAEAKAGWFRASKLGDDVVVGWFVNINGDGGLDPKPCPHVLPPDTECPECKDFVNVFIEVRAVDTKTQTTTNTPDVVGPSTQLPVIFSAGAPRISNPKITATGIPDRDYFEGINGSGIFKIESIISDDKGITNTRVKLNGIDYQLIQNGVVIPNNINAQNAGISITAPTVDVSDQSRVKSILTITVDTKNNAFYTANFGFGRTGYLDLDINVQDNNSSPMFARGIYKVGVDNYYPTTSIETQFNASSVKRDESEGIAGNKFELSGIAKDYGTSSGSIQEMARILVFFQEAEIQYIGGVSTIVEKTGGAYMNQRGIRVGQTDPFYNKTNHASWYTIPSMATYPNVRTADQATTGTGVWGTSINWFPLLEQKLNSDPNIGYVWESPHALVIDNAESDMWLDSDDDGTYGEVWSGLVDKTWRAFIDTEYFPDGPLMVHYIVMDQAGNATRYQRGIYVENHKPQIVNINFGTNFRGTTNIAQWTSPENHGDYMRDLFPVGTTTSGNRIINFEPQFRIRGNQLAMRIQTIKGNGTINYEVSHVTPLPRISAANMVRGRVYTIETPGTTDWQKLGASNNTRHTTFVASGPGEGTGYVVQYSVVGTPVTGQFAAGNPNINNLLVFNSSYFGTTSALIQDSPKTAGAIVRRPISERTNWPSDWEVAWPERLFIVKVYDSTVTGSGIRVEDQLAHAIIVALDVDNTDTLPPGVTVAPFGKKYLDLENEALKTNTVNVSSYEENIVMSGAGTAAKKEGYVQYAEHSSDLAAPDVSGQVIFLGKTSDNQRIQNINVTIAGFNGGSGAGTMFRVANYNTTTGKLESVRDTMGTGNNAWYFKITSDHLTLNYGHTANWEFAWDTSEVSYTANSIAYRQVGNQDVIVTVNDYRPTTPAPSVASNTLRVRIVPYISEVVTSLSGAYKAQPSAFARSSTGYYSVRENEEITIKGFNLGTNEATAANTITGITIGSTSLTYDPATTVANGNFRIVNKNEIIANVGATAVSGDLTVHVGRTNTTQTTNTGRTASINNTTRKLLPGQTVDVPNEVNRVPYNWEPNRTNNDILTNDRKLYIWSVGSLFNIPTTGMQHPFMRMTRTGQRYMSYNTAVSNANLTLNIDQTAYTLESTQNRYLNTTVAVDDNGFWYLGTSNQTAQANNYFAIHARGASSGNSTNAGTNKARVLNLGANTAADPAEADRVKIPRIFARTTGTNAAAIANSYQNNFTKQINFHYGNFSGNAGTNNTNRLTATGDFSAAPATVQRVAQNTSTYPGDSEGSGFTAVGILSNGQPVVAWYTGTDLVMSYGHTGGTGVSTATQADDTNRWQLRATVVQAGFGSHVDMTVDGADNVHMAYYNANDGGLYYAFIPRSGIPSITTADGGNTKITGIETARVDTFLSAGTKIMISVRDESTGTTTTVPKYVPYISYYHGSFSETKSAIRVAWPVTTVNTAGKMSVEHGTDTSDLFTGKWEVMTVPVIETPSMAYIICNGVPRWRNNWALPPSNWGYYNGTATVANSYANRTILVGYLTGSRYEGAMLKANLFAGAPTGTP